MTLDEEKEYAHYLTAYAIAVSGGTINSISNASLRCMAATAIGAAHAKGIPEGMAKPPRSWIHVKPRIDALFDKRSAEAVDE